MALSTEIPQDIIDEIIDILRNDREALKACTSVSHSFRLQSRKLLFSMIIVDCPGAVASLRRILYRRPEISRFIHTLRISSLDRDTIMRFPPVLPRLNHVRHLELGKQGSYPTVKFDNVLTDYNFIIMEVLKLPQIHTLSLHSILRFPSVFLRIPAHLTYLNMMYVGCARPPHLESPKAIPRQPLKSVHVYDMLSMPEWPLSESRSFQQLIVGKSGQRAQPIVDAGSQSLEDIIWRSYTFYDYGSVNFSKLRNLRRLSFEIMVVRDMEEQQIKLLWESIANLLDQGSVAKHLEVLNFALKPHQTLGYLERDIPYLGESNLWLHLADSSCFPQLQKITIHLDNEFFDSPVKKNTFESAVRQNLPLLEGTGMLYTELCEDFDWKTFL